MRSVGFSIYQISLQVDVNSVHVTWYYDWVWVIVKKDLPLWYLFGKLWQHVCLLFCNYFSKRCPCMGTIFMTGSTYWLVISNIVFARSHWSEGSCVLSSLKLCKSFQKLCKKKLFGLYSYFLVILFYVRSVRNILRNRWFLMREAKGRGGWWDFRSTI